MNRRKNSQEQGDPDTYIGKPRVNFLLQIFANWFFFSPKLYFIISFFLILKSKVIESTRAAVCRLRVEFVRKIEQGQWKEWKQFGAHFDHYIITNFLLIRIQVGNTHKMQKSDDWLSIFSDNAAGR